MSVVHRLRINRFRGACQPLQLDFDASKKMALILGDSGSGKSCIADALEFALTGSFGSLSEKHGLGRESRIAGYLRSVGSPGGPVEAEVSRDSGSKLWKATLGGTAPVLTGSPQRPPISVLRRSRLLSFIETDPAQRYDGFASIVDVPSCLTSEEGLREALRTMKRDAQAQTESLMRDESALENQWKDEGSPGASWSEWAESLAKLDTVASEQEASLISAAVTSFDALLAAKDGYDGAKLDLDAKSAALATANRRLANAQKKCPEAEIFDMMSEAARFLKDHPAYAKCPVCEKPNDAVKLAAAVEVRLASLRAVRAASAAQKQAADDHRTQDAMVRHQITLTIEAASGVVRTIRAAAAKSAAVSRIVEQLPLKAKSSTARDSLRAAISLCAKLAKPRKALADRLGVLQKAVGKASIVRRLAEQVSTARRLATAVTRVQTSLDAALKTVENCRKTYVNGILLEVAGAVVATYGKIHPDEPLGDFKFWLERRSSLMLASRFGQLKDIDPQAYYSESHLDTLGLSIFLALEGRLDPGTRVIVLDDVITSADQPHLRRVMDVLLDLAPSFGQVIVTTHYGRFYEDMKRIHGSASQVQFMRLRQWTFASGIRVDSVRLPADDLRAALGGTPFDAQTVASKAGVLLESMLEHTARKLGCPAPLKDTGLTIGDLLPSLQGVGQRLKTGVKAAGGDAEPGSWVELQPLLARIRESAHVRNLVGAHFNLAGAELCESDVRTFGELVLALHKELVCPHCGEMARRSTGSCWRCGGPCGRFVLAPLHYRKD